VAAAPAPAVPATSVDELQKQISDGLKSLLNHIQTTFTSITTFESTFMADISTVMAAQRFKISELENLKPDKCNDPEQRKRISADIDRIIGAIKISLQLLPQKSSTFNNDISRIKSILSDSSGNIQIEMNRVNSPDLLVVNDITTYCKKYGEILNEWKTKPDEYNEFIRPGKVVLQKNQLTIENIKRELDECASKANIKEAEDIPENIPEEIVIDDEEEVADTQSHPEPRIKPRYNGAAKYMFRVPDDTTTSGVV
jgi:hypothetical protein